MHAPRRHWLGNPYVLPVAFVALCIGDVAFAFGFHAFLDRGRGLYGSTVFTIIVAVFVFFGAAGWLLSASLKYVDVTSTALPVSARVPKPKLFFLIFMAFIFVAMDIWFWVTDRFILDLPNVGIQFLWIGYFAVQYAYDRWRWRRSVAGEAPPTREPPGAYAGSTVMLAILLTMYLSHPHVFPPWMLVFIVLLALGIGVALIRALRNPRAPSKT